jgi:hypothetical protein
MGGEKWVPWRTCFLNPPQNRPICPMTSVTSSFSVGEDCPATRGGGVAVPGVAVVSEVSKKFILGCTVVNVLWSSSEIKAY